ncbi:MAG TPA: O-antigen ligase family protein [Acidimicrobiales bacterium]|nr:O-antigen ligase family protein [Acidimicrobiales bacterium]
MGTKVREDLFVVMARRLVYAGLVFLPLLHYRVGSAFDLSDLCFLVAAVFLILTRRPPPKAPPAPAWYFGSFVWILAGVVASAQAVSKTASLQVVFNAIFVFFVLQWMLRQLLDSTARIRAGMVAFVVGSSISAFVAFLQTEFHMLGYSHQASLEGSRAVGLSNQPNIAAVTFALGLVFAIGLVVEVGLRRYWYVGVCIAVLASALIFSASVSGMSSTLVGCFVLFVTRGFRLRTVLGVVAALAIVYVAAISLQSNGSHFNLDPISRIEQTTGTNTGYNTVNPRVATLEHSWSGIVQSPVVGHGLDQTTISVYYDADVGVYYPAHNIVILYWFAGGIFMVAAGALMMGSSLNRLVHGRRRGRLDADRALRDTVLAGCITVLFFSFQSPEIVDRWLWLPFMLALCFRVNGASGGSGPREMVRLPEPEPVPVEATTAPGGHASPHGSGSPSPSPYETAEPLPVLRRVSGTVPAAARARRPS